MQEEQMRASQDASMNKEENTFPADNGSSLTAVYRKRGMAYYIMVSLIQEGQIQLKSTNEPIKTIRPLPDCRTSNSCGRERTRKRLLSGKEERDRCLAKGATGQAEVMDGGEYHSIVLMLLKKQPL